MIRELQFELTLLVSTLLVYLLEVAGQVGVGQVARVHDVTGQSPGVSLITAVSPLLPWKVGWGERRVGGYLSLVLRDGLVGAVYLVEDTGRESLTSVSVDIGGGHLAVLPRVPGLTLTPVTGALSPSTAELLLTCRMTLRLALGAVAGVARPALLALTHGHWHRSILLADVVPVLAGQVVDGTLAVVPHPALVVTTLNLLLVLTLTS